MSVKLTILIRVLRRVASWVLKRIISRRLGAVLLVFMLPALAVSTPFKRLMHHRTGDSACVISSCSPNDVEVSCNIDSDERSILVSATGETPTKFRSCWRRNRNVHVDVNTRPDIDLDEEAVEPDYIEPDEPAEQSLFLRFVGIALVFVVALAAGVYSLVVQYNNEHNS